MTNGQHPAESLIQELSQANNNVLNVGTLLAEALLRGEISGDVTEQPEYIAASAAKAEAEERLSLAINPRFIFEA